MNHCTCWLAAKVFFGTVGGLPVSGGPQRRASRMREQNKDTEPASLVRMPAGCCCNERINS